MAKLKKWIQAKKAEVSRAKNFNSQSRAFFTLEAKQVFTKLRQAFIKASILNHFDLKCHIQIEIDVLSYIIGKFSIS